MSFLVTTSGNYTVLVEPKCSKKKVLTLKDELQLFFSTPNMVHTQPGK